MANSSPSIIARSEFARSPWPMAMAALTVLLLAIGGLFANTAVTMVGIWYRSETFAHAFLVPPISAWLIWRLRHKLQSTQPFAAPWVLVPMALVSAVWLVGELAVVNALTQFALVALLVLGVLLVLGTAVARVITFPLAYLFFAVPVGEFLLPVLMEGTADFTVAALTWTGVPVYREGLQFVIPSGNWSVVEACSGVRYLIASLVVGTLFAYLNYRSPTRRWIFAGVSIAVPIVANWLRAYMIVMLGHLSNNRIAVGVDHLIYGWIFFGVVIMLLFKIGSRWAEADAQGLDDERPTSLARPINQPRTWLVAMAGIAVAALGPASAALLSAHNKQPLPAWELIAAPGWVAVATSEAGLPEWEPIVLNPASSQRRVFRKDGGMVVVDLAQYRDQNAGSKLVSSENQLARSVGSGWNLQLLPDATVGLAEAPLVLRAARLQEVPTIVRTGRPQITVWTTYWVDGRWTSSDHLAKLWTAWSQLRGRGDDGASVVISVSGLEPVAANELLARFARENLPAIGAQLHRSVQAPRTELRE